MLVVRTMCWLRLVFVTGVFCFVPPAFSVVDNDGVDSLWDVKSLAAYLPLYKSELRVVNEEALMLQSVSLSPKEGYVLDFSQQRNIAILSKPLLSEGQFLYRENEGICWAINKPFLTTLVLMESTIVQKNEDGSEHVIDGTKNPIVAELTGLFTSIFSGNNQKIFSAFDVYLLQGKPSLMPKAGWMLGLKPKSDLMIGIPKEIRLVGEDNLRWIWFSNKSGDETLIEFSAADALRSENVVVRCFGRT